MTIDNSNMGEQPIFSCKAHVFHIDPKTKRSWIPASSSAVSVSFFYDSTRQLYRIISVEGTKVKDATRSVKQNGTLNTSGSNVGGNITSSVGSTSVTASPLASRAKMTDSGMSEVNAVSSDLDHLSLANSNDINSHLLKSSLVTHQRSQSLSVCPYEVNTAMLQTPRGCFESPLGLQQSSGESPKHKMGSQCDKAPPPGTGSTSGSNLVDAQAQLKYENDRLKLALAQSSANAKKWEIELNSLKTTNSRLTSALQESTANVEEWKKQLQTYKEENSRMKSRLMDLEAGGRGCLGDADELSKELSHIRAKMESAEEELHNKDQAIEDLRKQLQRSKSEEQKERLQQLTQENEELRMEVSQIQSQLEVAMATQDSQRGVVESVNLQLGERIKDLLALHQELNHLLTT